MANSGYEHPATHPASIIVQDANNRFATDTEKAFWNAKASTDSPAFTGSPTVPTQADTDNSTKAASTAFVKAALAALVDNSPGTLDTLNELAAALGDDPNFATTITALVGEKLAKASNLSDLTSAAQARTNLGLGAVALLASISIGNVTGLTTALAGKATTSHAATHGDGGSDEITVKKAQVSDFPAHSGATQKTSSGGALTIGFKNADPVMIYTNLTENISSLILDPTNAELAKGITWFVKGNYSLSGLTAYNKSESSSDYGGEYARIDLEAGVNPTDGTIAFWYNLVNIAS